MPYNLDNLYPISNRAQSCRTSDKIFSYLYIKDPRVRGVLTIENMFALNIKNGSFISSDSYHCVSLE